MIIRIFFKKKSPFKKKKTWHIGPPCVLRVSLSPIVMHRHVSVRVQELVRRLFSQCSGLIRKGATRLTSVLESCGTPRGDSTYPPHSDFSVVAGDVGGSENTLAWNLALERRVLGYCDHCLNVSCRPDKCGQGVINLRLTIHGIHGKAH